MKKWLHKLYLDKVLEYQKVSEEFIREKVFPMKTKGRIDDFRFFTNYVLKYQNVSKDFIREMYGYLDTSHYNYLIHKKYKKDLIFRKEL